MSIRIAPWRVGPLVVRWPRSVFRGHALPSRRPADPVQTDAVFRILTVCTGNLCRSPQAEQLLRTRIPAALGTDIGSALEVTSAGTMAYDGDPMDVRAAAEAVRLGIEDAQQHRARRIRAQHVVRADLILGMAREHRGAAASLAPTANRRVFTLVEFARITESLAAGDFDVVPPTLAEARAEQTATHHAIPRGGG